MLFENNFEDGKDISGFEFLEIQLLEHKLNIKKFVKSKIVTKSDFPSNKK